jgi:RNB domain
VLDEAQYLLDNADVIPDPDERLRRDLRHLGSYAVDREGATEVLSCLKLHLFWRHMYNSTSRKFLPFLPPFFSYISPLPLPSPTFSFISSNPVPILLPSILLFQVDDAVSLERLEDGREKLWIHIADVSRWIRPGSQLSLEVGQLIIVIPLLLLFIPSLRLLIPITNSGIHVLLAVVHTPALHLPIPLPSISITIFLQ